MGGPRFNDVFPGKPVQGPDDPRRAEKAWKAFERWVKYGWAPATLSPAVQAVLSEDEWARAFTHYVWDSYGHGTRSNTLVRVVPEWLNVIVTALHEKYRTSFLDNKGREKVYRGKAGDFIPMVIGWCSNGGRDALEGRAKPLAAVIMLCAPQRAEVEKRVNEFINEVGF